MGFKNIFALLVKLAVQGRVAGVGKGRADDGYLGVGFVDPKPDRLAGVFFDSVKGLATDELGSLCIFADVETVGFRWSGCSGDIISVAVGVCYTVDQRVIA